MQSEVAESKEVGAFWEPGPPAGSLGYSLCLGGFTVLEPTGIKPPSEREAELKENEGASTVGLAQTEL